MFGLVRPIWIAAGIAAVSAVAAPSGAAHASDRWTRPYPGVAHLHRSYGPFDYHLVTIDLRDPRVTFVSTPEEATLPRPSDPTPRHHWMRTTSFASLTGADIAINGNYYEIFHAAHSTCGFTMSGGHAWRSTYQDRRLDCFDSVGFGPRGRVAFFDSRDALFGPAPEAWVRDVLTGSPRLLRDGEVVAYTHPRHALSRNPRTAVGVSRDGRTLFLLVVNGREGHAQGMTCQEAARTLRSMGAWDAINLDGGGSSTLFIRREHGLVSRSADGFERPVGNHFGIAFRDPGDEPREPEAPAATRLAQRIVEGGRGTVVPERAMLPAPASAATHRPQPVGRSRAWSALATLVSSFAVGAIGARRRRPERDDRTAPRE